MPAYAGAILRPPRTLTELEQATPLEVNGEHRDGFRDHVIFAVALGTGLREHEIAALDVGDPVYLCPADPRPDCSSSSNPDPGRHGHG